MPKRSKENSNYTTASSSSSKKNLAIGIAGHNRKPREETETSLIVLAAHALHYDPRTCSETYPYVSIRIYQTARRVIRWIQYISPEVPAHLVFSANSFFAAYVLCRLASPICPKWWWRQCRWLCKSKPPTYRGKNADRIDSHRFVLVFLAFDGFLHAVLTGQWTVVLGS